MSAAQAQREAAALVMNSVPTEMWVGDDLVALTIDYSGLVTFHMRTIEAAARIAEHLGLKGPLEDDDCVEWRDWDGCDIRAICLTDRDEVAS